MKKLIALGLIALWAFPALGADLPTKAPPAPVVAAVPLYNWTGFYVGAHGGYAGGNVTVTDINGGVNPGPFNYKPNGGIVGGQAGYNYQLGSFVVGIEGDIGYMALNGKGIIGSANAAAHQDLTLGSGLYGDVTGRVGYAVDRFLVYGKGGYAFFDGSAKQTTTNPGYVTTGTGTFNGWTAGGGVEYALTPNITIKAEYLHYDFGSQGGYQTNVGDKSSPIGYQFKNNTSLTFDTVKAGVNYRF